MFDIAKIKQGFKSINGWRNSSDPTVPQITDVDLLTTDSGLYYNDFHPLIDVETIVNSIPETKDLEDYLKERVDASIIKVFTKFSMFKKEMQTTKTILNSSAMFDGIARFNNTITNESKFVGFEIKLKESYGVSATIDRLGIQFNAIQTALPIYVFHSSQVNPIQTVTAATTVAGSMTWLTLSTPIKLKYYSDDYDTGGLFYIGYYQDDVNGMALQKDWNWKKFCGGCAGRSAVKIWNTRLNFMDVMPFYVPQSQYVVDEMFDYRNVSYTPDNNYGMNFATTIQCDLSEYFIENKVIFADAIGKQVAVDILSDIKHSNRANRIVEVNRNMIIRDLEGDKETNEKGLALRLEDALKSIDFDFSKIDSPCLPDNKKYGVTVKSV